MAGGRALGQTESSCAEYVAAKPIILQLKLNGWKYDLKRYNS